MDSPRLAPTVIGPYRIERELDRGGMGVVYLARDTRPALDRQVVLKALPSEVASDPERLQRFERESKLLALVHHPNVCGIYDVLECDGARYLALEHIEGESLGKRLARGALRVPEALDVCLQIASGMEAAHERGVIHRDLKPANVMLTRGGVAKIVDFGLAKSAEAPISAVAGRAVFQAPATLPTDTHTQVTSVTTTGAVLGTVPYLSPEQAEGKLLDRRTDIWAFGCVLYECLTGRRAFDGGSTLATITKILAEDPDWSRVPAELPSRARELLRRCLLKDPRLRVRDMGEARNALAMAQSGEDFPVTARTRIGARGLIALALVAAVVVTGTWLLSRGRGDRRSPVHLSMAIPPGIRVPSDGLHLRIAISPDGGTLLFDGTPPGKLDSHEGRVYRRPLKGVEARPIEGSGQALAASYTRDGKWIAFAAQISERTNQMRLLKVPAEGNAAPIAVAVLDPSWTDWVLLESGDVLVNDFDWTHYIRISDRGGSASKPTPLQPAGYHGSLQLWRALPRDRGVLLNTLTYGGGAWQAGVGVLDLGSGAAKLLIRDGSNACYATSGHLLFTRHDVLLAAPFDLRRLEVTGEPFPVATGLRGPEGWVSAPFDISGDGTLVYTPGRIAGFNRRLVVVRPNGDVSEWSDERQHFASDPSVTRGGTRVAVAVENARNLLEIWTAERGRPAHRLIADPSADCLLPAWSPDGTQVAYTRTSSDGKSGIYLQALGGGPPIRIYDTKSRNTSDGVIAWNPDGSGILIRSFEAGNADILRIPLRGASDGMAPAEPVLAGPANESIARLSPDQHLIAFTSDESGQAAAYVATMGPRGIPGEPVRIATDVRDQIRWNREGTRIYYATQARRVMWVEVSTKPRLATSQPTACWDMAALGLDPSRWDLLHDGSLLAIERDENEQDVTRFEVVLNFAEELRHPAGKP